MAIDQATLEALNAGKGKVVAKAAPIKGVEAAPPDVQSELESGKGKVVATAPATPAPIAPSVPDTPAVNQPAPARTPVAMQSVQRQVPTQMANDNLRDAISVLHTYMTGTSGNRPVPSEFRNAQPLGVFTPSPTPPPAPREQIDPAKVAHARTTTKSEVQASVDFLAQDLHANAQALGPSFIQPVSVNQPRQPFDASQIVGPNGQVNFAAGTTPNTPPAPGTIGAAVNTGMFDPNNFITRLTNTSGDKKALQDYIGARLTYLESQRRKELEAAIALPNASLSDAGNTAILRQNDERVKLIDKKYDDQREAITNAASALAYMKEVNGQIESGVGIRNLNPEKIGENIRKTLGGSKSVAAQHSDLRFGKDVGEAVQDAVLGNRAIQYTMMQHFAEGRDETAREMSEVVDGYPEKILNAYPTYRKSQVVRALGDKISTYRNPLFGTLLSASITDEDLKRAQAELQLTDKDMEGITPGDVVNVKGFLPKVIGGAARMTAAPAEEYAVRGLGHWKDVFGDLATPLGYLVSPTLGAVSDATGAPDWELINHKYDADWFDNTRFAHNFVNNPDAVSQFVTGTHVNTAPGADHLQDVQNDNAGKFNWDLRAISGTMADGIGNIIGIGAPAKWVGATFEGARLGVGALEGLNTVEKAAHIAQVERQGEVLGVAMSSFYSQYNNSYAQARQAIGDDPDKEMERNAYAFLQSLVTAGSEQIMPDSRLVTATFGVKGMAGRELIDYIVTNGVRGLEKESLVKIISKGFLANQKEASEELAERFGNAVVDAFMAPQKYQNDHVWEEAKQAYITGAIAASIPTFAGEYRQGKQQSSFQKEALFQIGSNPQPFIDEVQKMVANGTMPEADANQRLQIVNTMVNIVQNSVPGFSSRSVPLSREQRVEYANNLFQEKLLIAQREGIHDDVQLEHINQQVNALKARRQSIFDMAVESTPSQPDAPVEAPQEQAPPVAEPIAQEAPPVTAPTTEAAPSAEAPVTTADPYGFVPDEEAPVSGPENVTPQEQPVAAPEATPVEATQPVVDTVPREPVISETTTPASVQPVAAPVSQESTKPVENIVQPKTEANATQESIQPQEGGSQQGGVVEHQGIDASQQREAGQQAAVQGTSNSDSNASSGGTQEGGQTQEKVAGAPVSYAALNPDINNFQEAFLPEAANGDARYEVRDGNGATVGFLDSHEKRNNNGDVIPNKGEIAVRNPEGEEIGRVRNILAGRRLLSDNIKKRAAEEVKSAAKQTVPQGPVAKWKYKRDGETEIRHNTDAGPSDHVDHFTITDEQGNVIGRLEKITPVGGTMSLNPMHFYDVYDNEGNRVARTLDRRGDAAKALKEHIEEKSKATSVEATAPISRPDAPAEARTTPPVAQWKYTKRKEETRRTPAGTLHVDHFDINDGDGNMIGRLEQSSQDLRSASHRQFDFAVYDIKGNLVADGFAGRSTAATALRDHIEQRAGRVEEEPTSTSAPIMDDAPPTVPADPDLEVVRNSNVPPPKPGPTNDPLTDAVNLYNWHTAMVTFKEAKIERMMAEPRKGTQKWQQDYALELAKLSRVRDQRDAAEEEVNRLERERPSAPGVPANPDVTELADAIEDLKKEKVAASKAKAAATRAKGKQLADKVRSKKAKPGEQVLSTFVPIPPSLGNAALETVATAIEAGAHIAAAIQLGVDYINDRWFVSWDSQKFRDMLDRGSALSLTPDQVRSLQAPELQISDKNKTAADKIIQDIVNNKHTVTSALQYVDGIPLLGDATKANIKAYIKRKIDGDIFLSTGVEIADRILQASGNDYVAAILQAQRELASVLANTTDPVEADNLRFKYAAARTRLQVSYAEQEVLNGNITPVRRGEEGELPAFQLPDESWHTDLRISFQDRYARAEQAKKASTVPVDQSNDFVTALRLAKSKAEAAVARVREFIGNEQRIKGSFFDRIKKADIDLNDFGEWLYARHAKERNEQNAKDRRIIQERKVLDLEQEIANATDPAQIAKLEGEKDDILQQKIPDYRLIPDGGSGMTTQAAQDILDKATADGKTAVYEAFEQEFRDNVISKILQVKFDAGVISEATYNKLRVHYKNYVPLKENDEGDSVSSKEGHKPNKRSGRGIHRSKGDEGMTQQDRNNPLIQSIQDLEQAIRSAEQNKAAQVLARFAEQNENPEIWQLRPAIPKEIIRDAQGNIVRVKPEDTPANAIPVYRDGTLYFLVIKDAQLMRMVAQLKPTWFLKFASNLPRFFTAMNTLYNPQFMMRNIFVDQQDAYMSLLNEKGAAKKFRSYLPKVFSLMKALGGGTSTEWDPIIEEWKQNGGEISFLSELHDVRGKGNVEKLYDTYNNTLGYATRHTFQAKMKNAIGVMEQVTRVMAYRAARESGLPPERAALVSRNATVDFEKKGVFAPYMNIFKAFANAGTQGVFNVGYLAIKSKSVRKFLGATAAMGFMEAAIADSSSDCEDNFEDCYWEQSEYVKSKYLMLPLPGRGSGYLRIPLGRAFGWFPYMGKVIYATMTGKQSPGQATANSLSALASSFNFLGGDAPIEQQMVGNFAPLMQGWTNKNNFGSPIHPEKDKSLPSQNYFKKTPDTYIAIADGLHRFSGGSMGRKGKIEVSPNNLEFMMQSVFGGVYQFFGKTPGTLYNHATDETKGNLENRDIPMWNIFRTESNMAGTKQKYYDLADLAKDNVLTDEEKVELKTSLDRLLKGDEITEDQHDTWWGHVMQDQESLHTSLKKKEREKTGTPIATEFGNTVR